MRARFFGALALPAAVLLLSGCAWTAQVDAPISGTVPNNVTQRPWLSPTGRYVFFDSNATNLVTGVNTGGVFLRDQRTAKTTLVRADAILTEDPGVSDDLRLVLVRAPLVSVYDRSTTTTQPVAVDSGETPLAGSTVGATISADGRYVAFRQAVSSSELATYVRDLQMQTTALVDSVTATPTNPRLTQLDDALSLNRDGSVLTQATCMASGTGNGGVPFCSSWRLQAWDLVNGTAQTPLPDQPRRFQARLKGNGRQFAFTDGTHVWVRSLVTGSLEQIDAGASGTSTSSAPSISANGRYVAFDSDAKNLVPGVTIPSNSSHVFVRDRVLGITSLASADALGTPLELLSLGPAISGNGLYVTFGNLAFNSTFDSEFRTFTKATLIPRISTVVPGTGAPGTTVPVTIAGSGFRPDAVVQIGDGATVVASVVAVTETSLQVDVTVPSGTSPASFDVFVYNPGVGPGTASGAAASCTDCFEVSG